MYNYGFDKVAKSTKNIRRDIDWDHASYDKNELEKSKNHFIGKKKYKGLLGVGNTHKGVFRDKSDEESYKTLAGEENTKAINRNILKDQAIGAGLGAGNVVRKSFKGSGKYNAVADFVGDALQQSKDIQITPEQFNKGKKMLYRGGTGALALGAGLIGAGVATAVSPSRRLKKQLKNTADAKNMINAYHEDKENRGGVKMAYGYYQQELEKMARSVSEISKDVDWDKAQFDANELERAKSYFGKKRYSGRGGVGDRYYGAERDKSNELTYEDFLNEDDAKSLNTRATIAKGIGVGGVGGYGAYKSGKKFKKRMQTLTDPGMISKFLGNHMSEEAYKNFRKGEIALKAARKPKKIRNALLWGGAKTGIAGAIGYQGAKALSKSIKAQNRLNEIADAQNMINAYNEDRQRRARDRQL